MQANSKTHNMLGLSLPRPQYLVRSETIAPARQKRSNPLIISTLATVRFPYTSLFMRFFSHFYGRDLDRLKNGVGMAHNAVLVMARLVIANMVFQRREHPPRQNAYI